jgi:hypothetical protein
LLVVVWTRPVVDLPTIMCSNRVSAPCEDFSLSAIYSAWKGNQLYINLVDTIVTILKYQWRRLLHCTHLSHSSQALPDARCRVGARAPQLGIPNLGRAIFRVVSSYPYWLEWIQKFFEPGEKVCRKFCAYLKRWWCQKLPCISDKVLSSVCYVIHGASFLNSKYALRLQTKVFSFEPLRPYLMNLLWFTFFFDT